MNEELMQNLNEQQKEAVTTTDGPLLVLAGAGSGKTMVITYRIAYLIKERLAHPNEILAVTFTNKAAKEMKERVHKLVGADVFISTFHSFCARFLRANITVLGYNSDFTIYDSDDQLSLMKDAMASLNIDKDRFKPKEICGAINRLKEDLVGPNEYENFASDFYEKNVLNIYKEYQKSLKGNNAVDFADLIRLTAKVFQEDKNMLASYQDRYKYILVDEYQDTNYAQYQLVKLLAAKNKNICVVGDPDQSIYSWRGADITNILNFEKDYDNALSIKLELNYRSKEVILDSANKVIEKNIDRHPKELKATRMGGEKIVFYSGIDSKDEADFICNKIKEYQEKGVSWSEIAIFYRMHALSRGVEEALIRNYIPYDIVGGTKFYDRKEIKDILAYLRCACNPADRVSFERIINVPKRSIGKASVSKIADYASSKGLIISDALKNINEVPGIAPAAKGRIQKFVNLINKISVDKDKGPISEVVRDLIERIEYEEYLKDFDLASSKDRIDNVRELVSSIAEYEENTENPSLQEYLNNIALISDLDSYEQDPNKVTLMTLHNAKGLEFDLCFVMALEEGIFPHSASDFDDKELEEERRLCYVGITRAKEYLFLTAANRRLIYGRWTSNDPSRFIYDIPDDNIQRVTGNTSPFSYDDFSFKPSVQREFSSDTSYEDDSVSYAPHLIEGIHVFHAKWGMGRIMQRDGNTEKDSKVKVQFQSSGLKELMLMYANLSVI